MRAFETRWALLAVGVLLLTLLVLALSAEPEQQVVVGLALLAATAFMATGAAWQTRRLAARQATVEQQLRRLQRVNKRLRRINKRAAQRVVTSTRRSQRAARDRDGATAARFEWLARHFAAVEDRIAEQADARENANSLLAAKIETFLEARKSLADQLALIEGRTSQLSTDVTRTQSTLEALQSGEHSQSLRKRLVADLHALLLLQEEATMPVIADWAMAPRVLDVVLKGMRSFGGAPQVVELGSGVSTVWIARELQRMGGGRVVALEHDAHYADQTRRDLEAADLTKWAEVRDAPLADVRIGDSAFSWYTNYEDLENIDVLVVDGPPGNTGPEARYPAIPLLLDKLNPGALVIVDDATRQDEADIASKWIELNISGGCLEMCETTDRAIVLKLVTKGDDDGRPEQPH